MARAPDERVKKAKELFHKGNKLVDIAKKLNIPEGTVRRWKSTYEWANEKSERSERIANERKNNKTKKAKENKPTAREVESVMTNPDLTDKQRDFCLYFIKSFNATRSYQKAYGCDYKSSMELGSRLLRNVKVKEEIDRLKRERYTRTLLSADDIFQKYMDIAFSDIGDYIEFRAEEVPVMGALGPVEIENEEGEKEILMKTVNVARFKDSKEVDTSVLSEIRQGKDGAGVKIQDRMRALQWLADHKDMATAEQEARMAKILAETKRIQAETEKLNQEEPDNEIKIQIVKKGD